jgi:hypothetical protein
MITTRTDLPRTSLFILLLLLVFPCATGWSRQKPQIPREDKIRITEAFRLGSAIQDQIWPGWSRAPFALMLVTSDHEFLLRHPHATNNFDTSGFDTDIDSRVLYRKRLFPTNLLATFPAINAISTIVVGQSANTGVSSSTAWVATILHEHFHQYQQSQPDYFSATQALGLSHGDKTGMWMLNFPFPYDSAEVVKAYTETAHSLLGAIRCTSSEQAKYSKAFFDTLKRLKNLLSADDFKYFSFQCWQEGVARYTELKVAEIAAQKYQSGADFRSLKDYRSFREVADSIRAGVFAQLANPALAELKRVAFYSFGAGEALLLDKVQPGWKRHYFQNKFHLEKNFSR